MVTQIAVDALIIEGRFREAALLLDSAAGLTHSQQILRAWVAAECHGAIAACSDADALLRHAHGQMRALCLEIQGLAKAQMGNARDGLKLLESAITCADGETSLVGRLEVRVGTALLNWIGVEPALARLPRIRRAVMPGRRALRHHCVSFTLCRDRNQARRSALRSPSANGRRINGTFS